MYELNSKNTISCLFLILSIFFVESTHADENQKVCNLKKSDWKKLEKSDTLAKCNSGDILTLTVLGGSQADAMTAMSRICFIDTIEMVNSGYVTSFVCKHTGKILPLTN